MRRFVVAALLVLATLAPTSTASAVPDPTQWSVLTKLSRGSATGVSCPATTWCWAIGGGELSSSIDGGASWTVRTAEAPLEVDRLDALDCPSAQRCFVAARVEDGSNVVITVTPSGLTTSRAPGAAYLESVSCVSDDSCLALVADEGGRVVRTTDGGAHWTSLARRPRGLDALSCVPASQTCTAVGGSFGEPRIARTDDLGATWTPQTAATDTYSLTAVDCATALSCHAVGTAASGTRKVALGTADGGASWSIELLPRATTDTPQAVTCPTEAVCFAFAAAENSISGFRTTTAGAAWTRLAMPDVPASLPSAACATVRQCAVVTRSSGAFSTTDSGRTWVSVPTTSAVGSYGELVCPATDWCVATTRDDALRPLSTTSQDGGRTWARHPLPDGTGIVTALDCATASDCQAWAVSREGGRARGQVLRSTDGGVTWKLRRGGPAIRQLAWADLECVDGQHCLAVGSGRRVAAVVRATSDGGRTWQEVAPPADAGGITSVSCTAAGCVLIGGSGSPGTWVPRSWTTTDLGATYTSVALPSAEYDVRVADCSDTVCMAVGIDGNSRGLALRSQDLGLTWARTRVPAATPPFSQVACSSEICAVLGRVGLHDDAVTVRVSTDRGRTLTAATSPPMRSSWSYPVACAPQSQLCLTSGVSPSGAPIVVGTTL